MKVVGFSLLCLFGAGLVSQSEAACANHCSGHGECGSNDKCSCQLGYAGGDCSQQLCSQGISFYDIPNGVNLAHNYAPCSGVGSCDLTSGTCVCEPGFTGKSCRRRDCPNQCNGHGVCQHAEVLAVDDFNPYYGANSSITYDLWDRQKIMKCKCDRGYTGPDCGMRQCPRGDDPLTDVFIAPCQGPGVSCPGNLQQNNQVFGLRIGVRPYGPVSSTQASLTLDSNSQFTITYFDAYGGEWSTSAIPFSSTCATVATNVQTALNNLPLGVLKGITVTASAQSPTPYFFAFSRNPNSCVTSEGKGSSFIVQAENAAECLLTVTFPDGPGTTGMQYPFSIDTRPRGPGLSPRSYGIALSAAPIEGYQLIGEVYEVAPTWNTIYLPLTELTECSGRGSCQYDSGVCSCYDGFVGVACEQQEALS